jgi:hypothetical protein
LKTNSESPQVPNNQSDAEIAPPVLASCLAFLAAKSPGLGLVVERWESIPEAVRAGIVAMVEAATGEATGTGQGTPTATPGGSARG